MLLSFFSPLFLFQFSLLSISLFKFSSFRLTEFTVLPNSLTVPVSLPYISSCCKHKQIGNKSNHSSINSDVVSHLKLEKLHQCLYITRVPWYLSVCIFCWCGLVEVSIVGSILALQYGRCLTVIAKDLFVVWKQGYMCLHPKLLETYSLCGQKPNFVLGWLGSVTLNSLSTSI